MSSEFKLSESTSQLGHVTSLIAHQSGCVALVFTSCRGVENIFVVHTEFEPYDLQAVTHHHNPGHTIHGLAFVPASAGEIPSLAYSFHDAQVATSALFLVAVPPPTIQGAAQPVSLPPPRRLDVGCVVAEVAVRPVAPPQARPEPPPAWDVPSTARSISGTTKLVAYIKKGRVWVAAAGAARAVWSPSPLELTVRNGPSGSPSGQLHGRCSQLSWCPNGDTLAFVVHRPDSWCCWAVLHSLRRCSTVVIAPDAVTDTSLCWSPPLPGDTAVHGVRHLLAFARSPVSATAQFEFDARSPAADAEHLPPWEIWLADPMKAFVSTDAGGQDNSSVAVATCLWTAHIDAVEPVLGSSAGLKSLNRRYVHNSALRMVWIAPHADDDARDGGHDVNDGRKQSTLIFPWERGDRCHLYHFPIMLTSERPHARPGATKVRDLTPDIESEVRSVTPDLDGQHIYYTAAEPGGDTPVIWRCAVPAVASDDASAGSYPALSSEAAQFDVGGLDAGLPVAREVRDMRRVTRPPRRRVLNDPGTSMEWSCCILPANTAAVAGMSTAPLNAAGLAFLRSTPLLPAHVALQRWDCAVQPGAAAPATAAGLRTHIIDSCTLEPRAVEAEMLGEAVARDTTTRLKRDKRPATAATPDTKCTLHHPLGHAAVSAQTDVVQAIRRLKSLNSGHNVTFSATDGFLAHGVLFHPPDSATKLCAALIVIPSGDGSSLQAVSARRQMTGCWPASRTYHKIFSAAQSAAQLGFTVIVLNQRGSTGFGIAHRNAAGQRQFGGLGADSSAPPAEIFDIGGAVRFLRSVDSRLKPSRIGLWGFGSYGACWAALAMTEAKAGTQVACAACCGGSYDMCALLELQAPHLFRASMARKHSMSSVTTALVDSARRCTPYTRLEHWNSQSRMLLVHGDMDGPHCAGPLRDAVLLATALRALPPASRSRCDLTVLPVIGRVMDMRAAIRASLDFLCAELAHLE